MGKKRATSGKNRDSNKATTKQGTQQRSSWELRRKALALNKNQFETGRSNQREMDLSHVALLKAEIALLTFEASQR